MISFFLKQIIFVIKAKEYLRIILFPYEIFLIFLIKYIYKLYFISKKSNHFNKALI